MKSREHGRSFGKIVLNSLGGVVLTIGGIGVTVGGTYDLFANRLPAEDKYNESLEKLKAGQLSPTELPEKPDIDKSAIDIAGGLGGSVSALIGVLILKENIQGVKKKR